MAAKIKSVTGLRMSLVLVLDDSFSRPQYIIRTRRPQETPRTGAPLLRHWAYADKTSEWAAFSACYNEIFRWTRTLASSQLHALSLFNSSLLPGAAHWRSR